MAANVAILEGLGYSLTGADVHPMIDVQGTLNTSGAPNLVNIDIVKTAAGPGRAISYKVGGVEKFYVDLDGNIATTGTISGVAAITSIPAGLVFPYAGPTPPGGYLECDGAAISRTVYSALFAAIGGYWGVGDGSTTFNVPNLLGRVVVGGGAGAGLTPRPLGQYMGEETHVLLVGELAAHGHGIVDPGHIHSAVSVISGGGGPNAFPEAGDYVTGSGFSPTAAAVTGISIAAMGSNAPHNIMQPGAALKYVIKY
jgi:microcystin-dependent protein